MPFPVRNRGGGGGGVDQRQVVHPNSPFNDAPGTPLGDLDAFFSASQANRNTLRNNVDEDNPVNNIVTIVTTGTAPNLNSYRWGGDDMPTSYSTAPWIPINVLEMTSTDRVALDTIEAGTANTFAMFSATGLADAPVQRTSQGVDSSEMIVVPDSRGVMFGAINIMNGGYNIAAQLTDGRTYFPIVSQLTSSGSSEPFLIDFATQGITPAAANISETFTGAQIQFKIVNANTGLATRYEFTSNAAQTITDCNIIIRETSHANTQSVFDWKRSTGGTGVDISTGANFVDIPGVGLYFEQNVVLYVTIEAGANQSLSLQGQTLTVDGTQETVPSIRVDGHVGQDLNLLTANSSVTALSDITNAGSGQIITAAERTKLAGLTQTTARTDEEIRDVVGATLVAGSNVTIAVDDNANTITINSTGGGGGTNPPADADRIYYGLASSSDTTIIDVTTLTRENDPTNPDTISSGVATAGQYFVIFVPMTHDITSITDTVLGQPVTDLFTTLDNAQLIDTIQFKSYIIGPLNAGLNVLVVLLAVGSVLVFSKQLTLPRHLGSSCFKTQAGIMLTAHSYRVVQLY